MAIQMRPHRDDLVAVGVELPSLRQFVCRLSSTSCAHIHLCVMSWGACDPLPLRLITASIRRHDLSHLSWWQAVHFCGRPPLVSLAIRGLQLDACGVPHTRRASSRACWRVAVVLPALPFAAALDSRRVWMAASLSHSPTYQQVGLPLCDRSSRTCQGDHAEPSLHDFMHSFCGRRGTFSRPLVLDRGAFLLSC